MRNFFRMMDPWPGASERRQSGITSPIIAQGTVLNMIPFEPNPGEMGSRWSFAFPNPLSLYVSMRLEIHISELGIYRPATESSAKSLSHMKRVYLETGWIYYSFSSDRVRERRLLFSFSYFFSDGSTLSPLHLPSLNDESRDHGNKFQFRVLAVFSRFIFNLPGFTTETIK